MVAGSASGSQEESLSDAMGVPCVDVAVDAWRVVMRAVADLGARLDWLGAIDLSDGRPMPDDSPAPESAVVALVRNDAGTVLVRTTVTSAGDIASVRDVFPVAAWHEREATEMVGVRFSGGDDRPLLTAHADLPLRRSFPLVARLVKSWPGAPSSQRRARVPGNNRIWQEAPHDVDG